MKKIFITLTILALVFVSCERVDYGDINQNPYSPTENNVDAMMRGAMIAFANQSGRAGYSVPALYAQYQSQPVYSDEQLYKQFEGSWVTNYVYVLNDLKIIYNTTDDVRGDTANMRAIAELMSIYVWKRITDTFGDVPYFEALQGNSNLSPNYTAQKEIYLDLIARTKAARDMMDPLAFSPDANTDIFYGGDIDKWGKYANSMILALSIQLSNASAPVINDAQSAFNEALNNSYGVIESNSDNFVFIPDLAGSMKNPIAAQRGGDFNISKELTDALNGYGTWGALQTDTKNVTSTVGNDPIDFRVVAYSAGGDGLPYGYNSDNYVVSGVDYNPAYTDAGYNFVFLSAAYTYLNRAEGSLIYATGEDTNTMLTSGITASFALAESVSGFAISAGAAATAANRIDDAAVVTMEQVIAEEKWFALFPDGYSAWAEQRRTGFPALHPAPEATNGGVIPHRMLYPNGESGLNPAGWAQGVSTLVPADDKNTSKIWWEN